MKAGLCGGQRATSATFLRLRVSKLPDPAPFSQEAPNQLTFPPGCYTSKIQQAHECHSFVLFCCCHTSVANKEQNTTPQVLWPPSTLLSPRRGRTSRKVSGAPGNLAAQPGEGPLGKSFVTYVPSPPPKPSGSLKVFLKRSSSAW